MVCCLLSRSKLERVRAQPQPLLQQNRAGGSKPITAKTQGAQYRAAMVQIQLYLNSAVGLQADTDKS